MGLTRITAQQISDSDFKQAVRVVVTTNINLTGAPSTVDGVTLAVNNRILVTAQSTASQNGLYYVATVGTGSNGIWTRTADGNETGEMSSGMIVVATEGTAYADSEWLLTSNDPIVVGTTSLNFINLAATIYSGTSNVIVTNSGNVLISTAGTANVITVANTGAYVTGIVSATGNVNGANLYIAADAVVAGNLTVNGTTTTINSNTITTNDKNITVANNQTTGAAVDGAGVDAGGGTPIATWRYNNATTSWQSNIAITPTANGSLALGGASNFWGTAYVTTLSATGNITGNYITGNGSQLTGLPASYGNANVVANLAALGLNPISTTGNITGGNILGGANVNATTHTGTTVSVAANVQGGNLRTTGLISATGNITGNYILGNGALLTGVITSVANINLGNSNVTVVSSGGNVTVGVGGTSNVAVFANTGVSISGLISATGNITGGNLIAGPGSGGNLTGANVISATTLSATGNVTGGNLVGTLVGGAITGTSLSVSGNVTGNYILGNGALLTGVITSVANINSGTSNVTVVSSGGNVTVGVGGTSNVTQFATTGVYVTGLLSATGNITGGNLITGPGSGGNLTGANVISATTLSATGNIAGGNVTTAGLISATGNITGTNLFGTIQTATQLNITALGTLSSLTVLGNTTSGNLLTGGLISATGVIIGAGITGTSLTVSTGNISGGNIVNTNANGVGNIGSATTYFNTVFAKATSAQYADLAEMYVADADYAPGTVVDFGGVEEITQTVSPGSTAVAGVISTNPSYLMNSGQQGKYVLPVALTGRVPCRVQGPVSKGDVLVSSTMPGVAQRIGTHWQPGCVIGKSLGYIDDSSIQTIEVVVGRT